MRSSNPFYRGLRRGEAVYEAGYAVATYKGVGLKIGYFLLLSILSGVGAFALLNFNPELLATLLYPALIISVIMPLIAFFFPKSTAITGSIYCVAEGLLLGTITVFLEQLMPGLFAAALLTTLAIVGVIAVIYLTGLVKVTNAFVRIVMMVTFSLLLAYLAMWIFSLIFPNIFAAVFSNFWISLLISFLLVAVACFYLLLDMRVIRDTVEAEAPKYLEWRAAFGLVFTTLWLYFRVLLLIATIAGDR